MKKEEKSTILNVDDVDAGRYVITRVLKKAGFEVWEAASGQEALNKVSDMPDLVILDVNLPDISGFEVCQRIKSDPATRNIPVLHLSATCTAAKDRVSGLDYGADGYLVQPVDPEELIAHIKSLLRLKEAEEKARQEAKQWQMTFDATNDTICTLDTEQRIQRCNQAFPQLLNKDASEIIGRHCWELIHGTQEPIPECPILRMKKSLHRESMELAMNQRLFVVTVDPVLNEAGTLAGAVHILHDITERKRAEDELKKFKAIAEAASSGISIVNMDGILQYVNQAFAKIHGYSVEELLGKHFSIVHTAEQMKDVKRLRNKMFQEGGYVGEELWHKRKDGTVFPTLMNATTVRDDKGNPLYFSVDSIDVTDRKRLEEEIQKSEKLESVGTLAGGIAHDFNNILTAILGNISLARLHTKPDDDLYEWLAEAERASLRAKGLTQQLLTFARGGAPVKKLSSISGLFKETATFALSGSNVRCLFSIPDDLWDVEVDQGQLSQVIHNIVINAQQAMPQGGTIQIRAENVNLAAKQLISLKEGRYLKVSIEDTGIGISEELIDKIFDPYFTTKQKGSGLGLATCYSVIKNHGGTVTVESKPGVGTTFHVYLPASRKQVRKKEAAKEKPLVGKGKILVMDDEALVRNAAGRMLKHIGYKEVEFARDGAEAIKLYEEASQSGNPFDAVILDLTITGGTGGKETIKKLLAIDPKVKAIVSSGYAGDPVLSGFKKFGFSGVVSKPYTIDELGKVLGDLVA